MSSSFAAPTSASDPTDLFLSWFEAAAASGVTEPEAVALATATATGAPSVRIVLYRGLSGRRPRFFTNTLSRKGRELAENPRCALAFHWAPVQRQVRVEGRAVRLTPEEDDVYFHSRPRGHRVSATVSAQSRPVASRAELEARLAARELELAGGDPQRPPHWGGYAIETERWEFWIGRQDRLHERHAYQRAVDGWLYQLLEP